MSDQSTRDTRVDELEQRLKMTNRFIIVLSILAGTLFYFRLSSPTKLQVERLSLMHRGQERATLFMDENQNAKLMFFDTHRNAACTVGLSVSAIPLLQLRGIDTDSPSVIFSVQQSINSDSYYLCATDDEGNKVFWKRSLR